MKRLLTASSLVMALVLLLSSAAPVLAQPIHLRLVAWSYDIPKAMENVEKFMELNPDIRVELNDISWYHYHDTLVAQFSGGAGPDVMYVADQWLPGWAEAGWLLPLEAHFPDMVAKYESKFPPYVKEGISYKGQVYGLPYYADTFVFIYDQTKLEQAGFTEPPATWEELAEQARVMKEKGISRYPIVFNFNQNEVKMTEIFYAMTYSRGEGVRFFDENMNPLFHRPGHEAREALQWLVDGIAEGIIDPNSLNLEEVPTISTLQAGSHAFAVMEKYTLAEINGPASPVAGQWKIGLMPGTSRESIGGVRFYALTRNAAQSPEKLEAAARLVEFLGGETNGEYVVTKRWAVENGLGFGISDLYDDPDVIEAFGIWGDVAMMKAQDQRARAKDGQQQPWYGPWAQFMRTQLNQAMAGRIGVDQALNVTAQQWERLKRQHER